jgi:release factor glutamine methyltransferase
VNKVPDNKLSSIKTFFFKELEILLGKRECKSYFELCCDSWLGMSKSDLILDAHAELSESQILKFLYGIKEFKKHVPIAHVLGEQYFYGLIFNVNKHVLIPRPETEELVDLIIKENQGVNDILDIGTGSGCIAISLRKALPNVEVFAIDVNKETLDVAVSNSLKNKAEVNFLLSDALGLSSSVVSSKKWDVVVSNPPYIPVREKAEMDKNVVDYDPSLALFVPDKEPLLFYDAIAQWAIKSLNIKGKLYFEIHEDFGKEVCELLSEIGFSEVILKQDLQGKDRIVKAIK